MKRKPLKAPDNQSLRDYSKAVEKGRVITEKSIWILEDPLFSVVCPHCNNTLLMSREPLLTRLKKWATQLKQL